MQQDISLILFLCVCWYSSYCNGETYVLAGHTLADDLSVLVDEHVGLGSGSVVTTLAHSHQILAEHRLAKLVSSRQQRFLKHFFYINNQQNYSTF